MPKPCALALASVKVPATKFSTRADLVALLDQARQRIDGSTSRISLTDLASDIGLAPHHFQRLFHKTFGETPRRYQDRRLFAVARDELATGSTATELATRLGYSDLSTFSRAFSRHFGSPPSSFRKN